MTILDDKTTIPDNMSEAKTLSYVEAQYNYQNYYIGTNRTEEQLKEHIYRGKLGEFIVVLKLKMLGHWIMHGVRLLQQKPDNGTDLIAKTPQGRVIQIQVKTFNGTYYNIYNDKRLQNLLDYRGYILVCDNSSQDVYIIEKKALKAFKQHIDELKEKLEEGKQLSSSAYHMPLSQMKSAKKMNAFKAI